MAPRSGGKVCVVTVRRPTASPVPKALLDRMRRQRAVERRRYVRASDWQGEYGYGAGRAHPSVEFATCPHCAQPPGRLCLGARGSHLGVHFLRSRVYREMKRVAREQIAVGGGAR